MAVFRVERTQNYTVMSNYHLRDKSLSLKAKGLLSLMLSLPETWDYTLSGLAKISLEGKDAIRATVVELEKAGYIQRHQTTGKDGKFGSNEYIIREYPVSHEPPPEGPSSAQPLSENPSTVPPSAGATLTENPTQINKDPVKKDQKTTDSVSTESFPFPSSPSATAQPPEAKGRKRIKRRGMSRGEMDAYREMIRENIDYDGFVRERTYDAGQLDEMVEIMVEAGSGTHRVCVRLPEREYHPSAEHEAVSADSAVQRPSNHRESLRRPGQLRPLWRGGGVGKSSKRPPALYGLGGHFNARFAANRLR